MAEYIDKNTAITAVGEAIADGASWFDALERIPPSDVRPVARGRWEKTHRHHNNNRLVTGLDEFGETHTIRLREEIAYDWMRCPYCHAAAADNFQNYCPNCGAEMEVEDAE